MKRLSSLCVLLLGLLLGGYGFHASSLAGNAAQAGRVTTGEPGLRGQPSSLYTGNHGWLPYLVPGAEPGYGRDPVALLQQRMARGEAQLVYSEPGGWLQSVLQHLSVPVTSQGLVFSRTSLQSSHISPANPRAIYFNDQVYVGWVRGAELIEIASVDPVLGSVFYTLEQKAAAQPQFVRNERCLQCHGNASTRYVNGPFVRSIYAESDGSGIGNFGSFINDHTSLFNERWGGWYVTGTHGDERHMGNTFFTEAHAPDDPAQLRGGNLTSLADLVDLRGYASQHSDIVALMVLAHQTQMHNLIVWLDFETRMALRDQADDGKGAPAQLTGSARLRIHTAVDEMLRYMLFLDEPRLRSPVRGTTSFAADFAGLGRRDRQGRSLRDLDLQKRLFRFPCSYLIYTEAFDNIPQPTLGILYRRLWLILSGQLQDARFAALTAADRQAILAILRETKPDLPEYFHQPVTSSTAEVR